MDNDGKGRRKRGLFGLTKTELAVVGAHAAATAAAVGAYIWHMLKKREDEDPGRDGGKPDAPGDA